MLLLTSTSDIVQVTPGTTGSDIQVHASWADNNAGTITPGRTNTASITGTSPTTVVGSPAGSTQRNVRFLSIRNNHGAVNTTILVEHFDGTNTISLIQFTLLIGELMTLDDTGRWRHYKADGSEYPAAPQFATRAEMEAATRNDVAVSPAVQHYHPGHAKCWVKCNVAGGALQSYNISSVTDTGAGLCSPQIATDFSSANWCCIATIERPITTLTVTNLKYHNIRNATQAAGAVTIESYDATATNHVQEDPLHYYMAGWGTLV